MTGKRRFTYKLLQNICNEFGIKLINDYSNTYLTRDTRIIGKCVHCENTFDKSFDKLYKNRNFTCEKCTKDIKFKRIKHTMVDKYGVEYAAQLDEFKDKMKSTTLEKYGVEHATQNKEVQNKIKETNLQKYGCEYGLQNEGVKDERKLSNLEKYGVEHCNQRQDIKDKIKNTCLEKYGTICPLQNKEIKDKIKKTNLEKYGYEYGFQNEDIKNKIKNSNLEKYGVEHNLQRSEIKEQIKQTNLKKYGVEYVTQCPEIIDKMTRHMYKCKEYIFPSGNIINIQGYEHYAIDELLKQGICETNIITGCKNVPTIWYYDKNGKERRHFVDIYIPNQNRCIEVKSTWTAKLHDGNIQLKQQAGKKLGYNYEIWVYDKEGIKVECLT
jgi:hypothetical protein